MKNSIKKIGKVTTEIIEELGYALVLLVESLYWLIFMISN